LTDQLALRRRLRTLNREYVGMEREMFAVFYAVARGDGRTDPALYDRFSYLFNRFGDIADESERLSAELTGEAVELVLCEV
jgi:hypothetical protein